MQHPSSGTRLLIERFSSPRQSPSRPCVPPGAISYTQNASSPAASSRISPGPPPLVPSSCALLSEAEPLHPLGAGHEQRARRPSLPAVACVYFVLRRRSLQRSPRGLCARAAPQVPVRSSQCRLGPELRRTPLNILPNPRLRGRMGVEFEKRISTAERCCQRLRRGRRVLRACGTAYPRSAVHRFVSHDWSLCTRSLRCVSSCCHRLASSSVFRVSN